MAALQKWIHEEVLIGFNYAFIACQTAVDQLRIVIEEAKGLQVASEMAIVKRAG